MRATITSAAISLFTGITAAVTVGVAVAEPAYAAAEVQPSTRANSLSAMHGEALAHATYLAYAAQAAQNNHFRVARMFVRTAHDEFADHFTAEADLIGFGASGNADNLRDAIAGERYEATTMYPLFAQQATMDGCAPAALLFSEIAADEADHADLFAQALAVLTDPSSGDVIPTGQRVRPVAIPEQAPVCQGRTLDNLRSAMAGEAFANAKYRIYAQYAYRSGLPRLARLFNNAASAERGEHFAEEACLAGLVGPTARNLGSAIAGETYEATTMYPTFARQASAEGDTEAAGLFREIAQDEAGHARNFARALFHLLS